MASEIEIKARNYCITHPAECFTKFIINDKGSVTENDILLATHYLDKWTIEDIYCDKREYMRVLKEVQNSEI